MSTVIRPLGTRGCEPHLLSVAGSISTRVCGVTRFVVAPSWQGVLRTLAARVRGGAFRRQLAGSRAHLRLLAPTSLAKLLGLPGREVDVGVNFVRAPKRFGAGVRGRPLRL